jgi:uncharacterized OB-fold protein
MTARCDLCGTHTYVGHDDEHRYCPACESARPVEKIEAAERGRISWRQPD